LRMAGTHDFAADAIQTNRVKWWTPRKGGLARLVSDPS
jgi:hypothetical protein